jgi:hypothetical protein
MPNRTAISPALNGCKSIGLDDYNGATMRSRSPVSPPPTLWWIMPRVSARGLFCDEVNHD